MPACQRLPYHCPLTKGQWFVENLDRYNYTLEKFSELPWINTVLPTDKQTILNPFLPWLSLCLAHWTFLMCYFGGIKGCHRFYEFFRRIHWNCSLSQKSEPVHFDQTGCGMFLKQQALFVTKIWNIISIMSSLFVTSKTCVISLVALWLLVAFVVNKQMMAIEN